MAQWNLWRDRAVIPIRQERKPEMKKIAFVLFILTFLPVCSFAQGLGSIVGRVIDPSGAAVANAKVTAIQASTGFSRTAVTDSEGLYVLPSLPPSIYNLTVEATGFSTMKQGVV